MQSHGTLVKIGDGGTPTEVFTTIAKLKDIKIDGMSRNMHESAIQQEEWINVLPGVLKAGNASFGVSFLPSDPTHDETTGLIALLRSGAKTNFQFMFPNGKTWQFAGYVSGFPVNAPADGELTGDVTITFTGDPAPQFL